MFQGRANEQSDKPHDIWEELSGGPGKSEMHTAGVRAETGGTDKGNGRRALGALPSDLDSLLGRE